MAYIDVGCNSRVAIRSAVMSRLLCFVFLTCVVSACGMKGDLYLPEESPSSERTAAAESSERGN